MDEFDEDAALYEDVTLWMALNGDMLPNFDKHRITFEKDREPHGWLQAGRVRKTCPSGRGWEVVNEYGGTLEFVLPEEVILVEPPPEDDE